MVWTNKNESNLIFVDLTLYPSGIYIAKILTKDGQYSFVKLLKNN